MKKLSMVDAGFLLAERREMPMHVAGINLYRLPDGVDEQEFISSLADNMRDADRLLPPFGDRLKSGRLGVAASAYWEPDPELDMDYHIRHSALPKPGRYRELFTLVSRLHSTLLDRNRPLWEMHLIEGLQNRQFATYIKSHHAAVDGARSIHVARSMLSSDPNHIMSESPLSLQTWLKYRAALKMGKSPQYTDAELRNVADALKSTFDSSANVFRGLQRVTRAWSGRGGALRLPHMKVPRSSINTPIGTARRFVAQSWPFERLSAVGKAFDGTFNDAVLAMCSGALQRYLTLHAELPNQSLKAMVPVSIREEGDVDSSNAIAAVSADLATNIDDVVTRVKTIQASMRAGRSFFAGMSSSEIQLLAMLLQTPSLLSLPLGLASKMPPYNTVISNVPGIRETMYWNGARLDGSYPVSIVMDGIALNITLLTYGNSVDFGIIACRRSMPQIQRLIDYMEESLVELEDAAGLLSKAPSKRRRTTTKKTPSGGGTAKRKQGAKRAKTPTAKTKTRSKAKAKRATEPANKAARRKTSTQQGVKPKLKAKSKPGSGAKPKQSSAKS